MTEEENKLVVKETRKFERTEVPDDVYSAKVLDIRRINTKYGESRVIDFEILEGKEKSKIVSGFCPVEPTPTNKLGQWLKALGFEIKPGIEIASEEIKEKRCRILTEKRTVTREDGSTYETSTVTKVLGLSTDQNLERSKVERSKYKSFIFSFLFSTQISLCRVLKNYNEELVFDFYKKKPLTFGKFHEGDYIFLPTYYANILEKGNFCKKIITYDLKGQNIFYYGDSNSEGVCNFEGTNTHTMCVPNTTKAHTPYVFLKEENAHSP